MSGLFFCASHILVACFRLDFLLAVSLVHLTLADDVGIGTA